MRPDQEITENRLLQSYKQKFLKNLENGSFSFFFAVLAVIIMPVHVDYIPPVMILWTICWILENRFRSDKLRVIKKHHLILFVLVCLFYVWQAIGVIYSSDLRLAFLNLFSRLSLIIFPLILSWPGIMLRKRVGTLIKIFALCTFFYMVFCFIYAAFRSLSFSEGHLIFNPVNSEFSWQNYFYATDLAINQHPSYLAIYVLISAIIGLESFMNLSETRLRRIGWMFISLFLLGSLYFISSRAAILIAVIIIPLYFVLKIFQAGMKKTGWVLSFILISSVIVSSVWLYQQKKINPFFFSELASNKSERDPRLIIWKTALEISKDNLLVGVGLGDVRNELAQEYVSLGRYEMARERLNAHNQFLEILLESGIIGLILFISIFGVILYIAIKDRNILYGFFLLITFMFFNSESVLYRFAGVSFFSMFGFLLIHFNQKKSDSKIQ